MSAAEARASGVPLIVPDRGGAADHARGGAGLTYRSCNALAAADATVRLLRDPPRGPFGGVATMQEHFAGLFADYAAVVAERQTARRVA
jgi:alpha-1,6-mannosyltransferase